MKETDKKEVIIKAQFEWNCYLAPFKIINRAFDLNEWSEKLKVVANVIIFVLIHAWICNLLYGVNNV